MKGVQWFSRCHMYKRKHVIYRRFLDDYVRNNKVNILLHVLSNYISIFSLYMLYYTHLIHIDQLHFISSLVYIY